jgi:2-octaprenyl-6-methoxyphenol hydroxylase
MAQTRTASSRTTAQRSATAARPGGDPGRETLHTEVLVVGGGLVGATLASALASAGIETVVVDMEEPEKVLRMGFDGRASAIAAGSRHMMEAIGLWDLVADQAQPILDIMVTDGRIGRPKSPFHLHYAHDEVGEAMGHIVENRVLRQGQQRLLPTFERLTHLAPVGVERVVRTGTRATATLTDGRRVVARLVAGCDGRGSPLRKAAEIRTAHWTYDQAGIVATLRHDADHKGTAHEHFLPSGPFAMLPMVDGPDGEHRSSIVWTERKRLAEHFYGLDQDAFAREVLRRFGEDYGDVAEVGPRFKYPLSGLHAERYIDTRLALVGDSAHAIHPIAGQGLNLGLRDVAALAECVVDARRLGLDVGQGDVLRRYQRWRRPDNMILVAATHTLDNLFSNDFPPLRLARDLGLAGVNLMGPVKKLFMRHAMGTLGDLPRLIQGRPL